MFASQRLEVLEGAEREGRRLAGLLEEGGALQNALRGDATAAREVCVKVEVSLEVNLLCDPMHAEAFRAWVLTTLIFGCVVDCETFSPCGDSGSSSSLETPALAFEDPPSSPFITYCKIYS